MAQTNLSESGKHYECTCTMEKYSVDGRIMLRYGVLQSVRQTRSYQAEIALATASTSDTLMNNENFWP